MTATITVMVKEVLTQRQLVIQGTPRVAVNHEEQYITITGVIRPLDVSRDNVVFSSQVADANNRHRGSWRGRRKTARRLGHWLFDFVWAVLRKSNYSK